MNTTELVPLPKGRRARAFAPATTANLGPGFDTLGLALSWVDETRVEVTESGVEIGISGEGASTLPRGEDHLMMRTLREGLADLGFQAPGLSLTSHNTIPLSGGLGSSSAAIVSALGLAWGLAHPKEPLDRSWVFQVAARIEGHPDNVGPAVFGGLVLTWQNAETEAPQAVNLTVNDSLRVAVVGVHEQVSTVTSRSVLPRTVPFEDAAQNTGRAALLVHTLAGDLSHLLEGTKDYLHQDYRAGLYPTSHTLVSALRSQGFAAAISGAGPTVVVLHEAASWGALKEALAHLTTPAMTVKHLRTGEGLRVG